MQLNDRGAATLVSRFGSTWPCEIRRLQALTEMAAIEAAGIERPQAAIRGTEKTGGGTSLIPLRGMLTEDWSVWGTSLRWFREQYRQALNNPNVGEIVLLVDSPGGEVTGVPETSALVYDGSRQKRTVAAVAGMAASAAYWIASNATELVVTPSGEVGSIGVWQMHTDISEAERKAGIRTTLISAGPYKVEGHPWAPLDDEARAEMQRGVDSFYRDFVSDVSRGRGVSRRVVEKGFGQGRMLRSGPALAAGMIDKVRATDVVIAETVQRRVRATAPPKLRQALTKLDLAAAQDWKPATRRQPKRVAEALEKLK